MMKNQAQELIEKGRLKDALEFLKKNVKSDDLSFMLSNISSSYYALQTKIINGEIGNDEQKRESNGINTRLLTFMDMLSDDKPLPQEYDDFTQPREKSTDIVSFLSYSPTHPHAFGGIGEYLPLIENKVRGLDNYSKFDDIALASVSIGKAIESIFNPFLDKVTDSSYLSELYEEIHFNEIAFSDALQPQTRLMIDELRVHPRDYNRHKRNLIVSALTLSLVRQYDVTKLYLLCNFIDDAEPFVWKRALVGLYFALTVHSIEIDYYLEEKLKRLSDNEDVQRGLEEIERILRRQDYKLPNELDNYIQSINDIAFFNEKPQNWFLEFRHDHPSVKEHFKNDRALIVIPYANDLPTNAFKYAFALNFKNYDAVKIESVLKKANDKRTMLTRKGGDPDADMKFLEAKEYREYVRELFFFFQYYPKEEFKNILEKNLNLFNSNLKDILIKDACKDLINARIEIENKEYDKAIFHLHKIENAFNDDIVFYLLSDCYLEINKNEEALKYAEEAYRINSYDIENILQIGFCFYKGFENYNEALKWFLLANEIDTKYSFTLKKIGACYYFGEKNYSEALKWFLTLNEIESKDPWTLMAIGACYYFGEKNYNEALKWFLTANEIESKDPWTINKIGDCYYLGEKNYSEALKWFLLVCEDNNEKAVSYNRIGGCYFFGKDNYSEALTWFLKANDIESNNAWTINRIGDCYYSGEKNYNEALKWYLLVKDDEFEKAWNHKRIGICYYFGEKNYIEASKWFLSANEIDDKDSVNYNGIGGCFYLGEKNYSEALKWFLSANEIDDKDSWNHNRIGGCYFLGEKNYSEALKWFLSANEIDDKDSWNHNQIGGCYYLGEKNYSEALKWFLSANEIDDKNAWNHNRIGGCYYLGEKNYSEALKWFLSANEIDDKDSWNHNQIGDCYLKGLNNQREALKWYKKSHELDNGDFETISKIIILSYKEDDMTTMESYLDKILKLEREERDFYGKLGWTYFVINQLEESKIYFEKAIKLEGHYTDYMNYGHILLTAGEKEKAINNYQISIQKVKKIKQFFEGMEEDYEYLEKNGITREVFDLLVSELRIYAETLEREEKQ
jgi:tetratricopeptide (TPR) repeat protein